MSGLNVNDLGRLQRIGAVFARYGFGHLLAKAGVDVPAPPTRAEVHTAPYARRLRKMLVELGPTFVKLGQILAMRPDLLPHDVREEFSQLQDRVDPMPAEDALQAVKDALPRPFEEVFESFDPTPLGAASIAQVHAATLIGGERVALKIQRLGIEPIIHSDLHILYTLANLVESRIRLPGLHTPTSILKEFDVAIRKELDFLAEMKATERMGRALANEEVIVPKVYKELSTRTLLVLEHIEGIPLSRATQTLPPEARRHVAHQLMACTFSQVFDHGFFHGDPHPGNLFVTPEGTLALLDFGVTGLLTSSMQDTIISTFTAMVFRDPDALAMTVYRAGATSERIELRSFGAALERKMVEYYGASLDDLANRDALVEVVELATEYKINLPAEFALLARSLALVEGNVRALLPGVDIVDEVKPYAEQLMRRRFSPEKLTGEMASVVLQLRSQLRELPTQASQVLMDLDAGRLVIQTADPQADEKMALLESGIRRVVLSLLSIGSLLGGAALRMSAPADQRPLIPELLIAAGITTLVVLAVRTAFPRILRLDWWRAGLWRAWRFFFSRTTP